MPLLKKMGESQPRKIKGKIKKKKSRERNVMEST